MVWRRTWVSVVIEGGGEREGVQIEGAVREHDAFGRAGAAAGVEELGGGGLVDGHEVGHRDGIVLEERGEGGVGGVGVVDGDEEAVGNDVAKLLDDGSEVVLVEERGGLRVAEDDFELRRVQAHVERHDDGAGERYRVVALEQRGAVEAEDADAVVGTNAVGDEACGYAAAAVGELGVGVTRLSFDHADLLGVEIQRAKETAQGCERNMHGGTSGLVVWRAVL